jgi:hypothetical protein
MSAWVPEHDKRQSKASAKVTDLRNTSKPGLKSHQAARDIASAKAAKAAKAAEASRTSASTSTSTTVTGNPTGSPATTTTLSQSTSAKRKQPPASKSESILDVEDEAEDSHVLPKGL